MRILIPLIVIGSFILEWLSITLQILPYSVTWMLDFLIIFMFIFTILKRDHTHDNNLFLFKIALFLLLLLVVFSAFIEDQSVFKILLGIRAFIRYILLFFFIQHTHLSEKSIKFNILLVISLALLQIPVSIIQFYLYGVSGDLIFGTVRDTGAMVIILLFVDAILLSYYFFYKKKLIYILLIILTIIPSIIGEGKFFFLLFPIVPLIVLRKFILKNTLRSVFVIVLLLGSYSIGANYFGEVGGNIDIGDFNIFSFIVDNKSKDQWAVQASSKFRILEIESALITSASTPKYFFMGMGIGSQSLTKEEFHNFVELRNTTSLSLRIKEFGIIGFILFVILILAIYFNVKSSITFHQDKFWIALVKAYDAIVLIYLISIPYTNIDLRPISCMFWFITASLIKMQFARKNEE